jgi:hypothetical protein
MASNWITEIDYLTLSNAELLGVHQLNVLAAGNARMRRGQGLVHDVETAEADEKRSKDEILWRMAPVPHGWDKV